ncbi:GGDEF domain-containing protein [Vagococcus zengguangii]|nr:GGDEF domain-containing protein [Vagococcus zengguangii]
MDRIESIISSITVNISIIFSSILIMYFNILKRIVNHQPIDLKHFNKMQMTRSTRISSGFIFGISCYLLSINGIQIDAWQKVDTRYLLIYFVMYYASTLSGFVCGLAFMTIKSAVILLHGYPVMSVEFLNNLILTSCTLVIAYICTRNKTMTWRNNLIFLIILFIVRAILIYMYIPFIDNQSWSPNLISYYLITGGLFIIIYTLIKSTIRLINSIITYKLSSQIDNLTSLFNRSALVEHFDALTTRYSYSKEKTTDTLTICILDLDEFKEINDSHGHAIGDQLLAEFTDLMRNYFDTNYLYRFGGDEFVLMFVNGRLETNEVVQHVQKFVENVEQYLFLEKIKPLKLSISVGLVQEPITEEINLQTLLSQSDTALYSAKGNGRNQLVIYEEKKDETN